MSIEVSRLQVSLEEGERWRRTLSITIPRELVDKERQAAIRRLSRDLSLPGFRKGKIPAAVVERRFGPAVNEEVLDRVIGESYRSVLQDRELIPINRGEVDEVNFDPASDADLSFRISFDVQPRPELARVEGFKAEVPSAAVTDEQVDRVVEGLRRREGTWHPVEEGQPVEGERVAVRIERLDEGGSAEPRKYELTLGEGEAIPDVEEAIRSLAVGTEGTFTITFPEGVRGAEEAGEAQEVRIHLDERSQIELPELDDDFARSVGSFEALEELRSKIREDMEADLAERIEAGVRDALLDQVISANAFDVPQSMVDHYIRMVISDGKDPDEVPDEQIEFARGEIGNQAEQQVKRHIVIEEIARARELHATPEDLDRELEERAEKLDMPVERLYSLFQSSGRLEQIESRITERKVIEFLKGGSTLVPVD